MSATGQGGVSIITGANHAQLTPVTLPAGFTLTFTHNLGKRAYSVICSDGVTGRVFTDAEMVVGQATDDAITVVNGTLGQLTVYIAVRWENLTEELDLVRANDSRVVITD